MAEWDAEIVVDPELARALIREQFPALARTVEPFGSGWDNTAYLVDGELVFRFPRRSIAVPLLEREVRVLPAIALRLPLPVPVPEWIGKPTETFPWPFAGYRRLLGRTADTVDLTPDERRAMAAPLAAFLRALHDTPMDGLGLPGDEFSRTDFGQKFPLLVERLAALEDAHLVDDARKWLRLFESGDFPAPPERPVLVHGDLAERHVLVDGAHRVCGVIDWGDVHAGDPALDLTLLFTFFPASLRGDFLRAYGDVDARTLRTARLRAAFACTCSTFYAHSVGDTGFLPAGLTAMKYVLEE
ncbi:MAG TPA: phosphotransferase [Longimicrobium sp.]|nr:phosphotransferase [Longimicrobium sp.]